jgi:hypothetical protein
MRNEDVKHGNNNDESSVKMFFYDVFPESGAMVSKTRHIKRRHDFHGHGDLTRF